MKMNRRDSNLPANSLDSQSEKNEIRLQVYLAHCGVASRRACEKIILDGRVTVNGTVVTELGTKVSDTDKVCVDGKPVHLEQRKCYVLLNKPAGFVCSASDEKGRQVAADLLRDSYKERLYNVGRLDMYSKGMILFTNDGDFAAKFSHPSSQIEKEYIVETSQDVSGETAKLLEHGVRIDNIFYKCLRCEVLKPRKIRIVLIEGKNREIRRMLESQNIGTRSLVRVRIGNVNLDDLRPGEFRDLTEKEVKGLLELAGSR
ncbi:MAG: rRNA pseudouridine synthase [Treponema sp.]|nr:rRNA pseudouridine synthase [Treponema sp.]